MPFMSWPTRSSKRATSAIRPKASASAIADVRSLSNKDLDSMEASLKAAIQDKLIPDTRIDLSFYRSRPAFEATEASRVMARHALDIFQEMECSLGI